MRKTIRCECVKTHAHVCGGKTVSFRSVSVLSLLMWFYHNNHGELVPFKPLGMAWLDRPARPCTEQSLIPALGRGCYTFHRVSFPRAAAGQMTWTSPLCSCGSSAIRVLPVLIPTQIREYQVLWGYEDSTVTLVWAVAPSDGDDSPCKFASMKWAFPDEWLSTEHHYIKWSEISVRWPLSTLPQHML